MIIFKQIKQKDIESAMNEISRQGIHYAQLIDFRFPQCCRILVKKLSSQPDYPLNRKLEISGTTSIQTVHCEPLLVDLLNPELDGFEKHQITPSMSNMFYSVVM